MAIIEAEPYPFELDPTRASLIIIDMQRDFLEPGGFGAALGNDVSLLRRTIAPTRSLLEEARAAALTVIHTLVRGEPGHDIIPELYPVPGEPVVDKPGKGAFFATTSMRCLRTAASPS